MQKKIRAMSCEELAMFLVNFKNTFVDEYEGEQGCMDWLKSEEHKKKMTRKMQKKIRRVQHWCNCKLYIKYAWYEFRAMVKGV